MSDNGQRYDKGYFMLTDDENESDGDYIESETTTHQNQKKDDTADGGETSLSSSLPAAHEPKLTKYEKSYFESSDDESDGEWREATDQQDEMIEEADRVDGAGAALSSSGAGKPMYDPSLFETSSEDEEYGEDEQEASAAVIVTAPIVTINERNASVNEPDLFVFDSGYTNACEPPPTRNRPLRPSDSDRELGPGAQACSNVYKALVYQLGSTIDYNKPDEDWEVDEPKCATKI